MSELPKKVTVTTSYGEFGSGGYDQKDYTTAWKPISEWNGAGNGALMTDGNEFWPWWSDKVDEKATHFAMPVEILK